MGHILQVLGGVPLQVPFREGLLSGTVLIATGASRHLSDRTHRYGSAQCDQPVARRAEVT
ncbi:hypothetical protein D7V88_13180 [Corallococcus terminator]|uniref:Uncharacterized protein n=1 Tax=Corallococcus terminator TaxID=2316733 RepID=A0A3A8JBF0_9BACT|nr:hypothetical protein D7V88_13180 [Corallococcus terminator]